MDRIDDKYGAFSTVDKLQHGFCTVTVMQRKEISLRYDNRTTNETSKAFELNDKCSTYLRHVCKSASMDPSKSDNSRW